jgi:hypothetical protein
LVSFVGGYPEGYREDLLVHKSIQAFGIGHVEPDGGGFAGSMLLDKVIQSVLTTPNGNDLGSLGHELAGESSTNAGGGTNEQDGLVSERHGERLKTVAREV